MKLLTYSLYLLMIADVIFQGWGIPSNVNWAVYYDLIHYGFAFIVSIYASIYLAKFKIIGCIFIIYFGFISVYQTLYFGMDSNKYWLQKSESGAANSWLYFAICLIIIFIFHYNVKKMKKDEAKR